MYAYVYINLYKYIYLYIYMYKQLNVTFCSYHISNVSACLFLGMGGAWWNLMQIKLPKSPWFHAVKCHDIWWQKSSKRAINYKFPGPNLFYWTHLKDVFLNNAVLALLLDLLNCSMNLCIQTLKTQKRETFHLQPRVLKCAAKLLQVVFGSQGSSPWALLRHLIWWLAQGLSWEHSWAWARCHWSYFSCREILRYQI